MAKAICYLKQALYGLRQEPKVWYCRIDTYFKEKDLIKKKKL